MIHVGIDCGLRGAIAAVNDKGEVLSLCPMPIAGKEICPHGIAQALYQIFYEEPGQVYIEKAQAMSKQGVSSMFTYGTGFGYIIGVCAAMAYPMILVPPRQWQKLMHAGADQSADPKDRSMQVALRLFPEVDFKATSRCKKLHDGLIDAVLIADYGRRLSLGK